MTQKVLLIIDIQNDYFPEGNFPLDNSVTAGKNAAAILDHFRNNDQPVIHIRHISTRPGSTFFLPGTQGAEIHESVSPRDGEAVIIKNFPNSFRETQLEMQLKELGATELVIAGMMSNMCVDATTRAAADLGYKCTVVEDACCAANLEFNGVKVESHKVHAAFMAALGMAYAEVVKVDSFNG